MAQKSLFSRGPFRMGLTMAVFGVLGFAAVFMVPAGVPGETVSRIFEVAGMFGGAMVGFGAAFMLIGYVRHRRS